MTKQDAESIIDQIMRIQSKVNDTISKLEQASQWLNRAKIEAQTSRVELADVLAEVVALHDSAEEETQSNG